ncbi:MAG: UDP-glucose--hexose-1-phosphate uridylyltransferase [Bacteroidales bacterium]|nr:UDP-glucose--hexose-1-phosphate uridylyltransferase [Bacteroidales bacterium]
MIGKLLQFGLKKKLFEPEDYNFVMNNLMALLKLSSPPENSTQYSEKEKISDILSPILDYAFEQKIIPDNTTTSRDKLDAQIMGILIARPSEIIKKFYELNLKYGIKAATDWYYKFSQNTNYIRTDRTSKNISWTTATEFGNIELTINLSKPEKDPKEIAAAKNFKSSGYPKCILCAENEGYQGDAQLPARQNHRIIPIILTGEKWFLQYSPYSYFNEHCIVLSEEHRPMKINKQTFRRLLEFVELFPHYFIGSNADLPIVGGSILSHDHFQGGNYNFPMANAPIFHEITKNNIQIGIVKWPMSVIRLKAEFIEPLIDFADKILHIWKNYSNPDLDILSNSNNEPHNTITPIARFRDNNFELDLVLRNNRTSTEFPDGIFHPHENLHHIKKENIGLIEVMGLAILPGRLLSELQLIEDNFNKNIEEICTQNIELEKHKEWIAKMQTKYSENKNIKQLLNKEVGLKFLDVLKDSGVFKTDETGLKAFVKFVNTI